MLMLAGAAALGGLIIWLCMRHAKFFESIWKTTPHNPYGVYTHISLSLRTHIWYAVRQICWGSKKPREEWEREVQDVFLQQFLGDDQAAMNQLKATKNKNDDDYERPVLVTHSCRAIFYYMITTLLEEALERTGKRHICIALCGLHFGSFYKLMKGIEKSFEDCRISFYEIDLHAKDWTLMEDSIQVKKLKECQLVLIQHLFGVPLSQERLAKLARENDVPILEDCVQSGSLYGQFKGHADSDMIMYSGGLDKTPQCFGAGLGYFRTHTKWGRHYFDKCQALHDSKPLDTDASRLWGCTKNAVHSLLAYNTCGVNYLLGLIAYVLVTKPGDPIDWYQLSLKIRTNKSIAPFQHAESGFLRRPSIAQFQSILFGMTREADYRQIALRELHVRSLLLQNIPAKYHPKLFPWFTQDLLNLHKTNGGISEFSWVVAPLTGQRADLCEFLNQHFIVSLMNTTWEASPSINSSDKPTEFQAPTCRHINDHLVYLPNLNMSPDFLVLEVAETLTKYCKERNL